MTLGEKALADGRPFHAALHFRSAEFFMDPRKQPTRARLLTGSRSNTLHAFTRDEDAQMYCQLGNFPLAVGLMEAWAEERTRRPQPAG